MALPELIYINYFHSDRLSTGSLFTLHQPLGFIQKLLDFGVNLFGLTSLSSMGICTFF